MHPAEGRSGNGTVLAQEHVHAIEQVGPQHRYFIDDESAQTLVELCIARLAAAGGNGLRRYVDAEPEKAMHCLAAHVQGRNPGRGQHHRVPIDLATEMTQQCGLAGAGATGNQQMPLALLHAAQRAGELVGDFNVRGVTSHARSPADLTGKEADPNP